ncbi:MAG: DUF1638 domain-containing protein [Gammaproteobacteria bacterium]|nr:DUF1638 domain-containing protein [Gammaproteobacteria bacterium]
MTTFTARGQYCLMMAKVLLIACGALAHELAQLVRLNQWTHVRIRCLPPDLHNQPGKIPDAVRAQIEKSRGEYEQIFVAYGDCGTGGRLDEVLSEYGIERLPGAHCYEFFAGSDDFAALAEAEAGTFYLTNFLTRHFDRLVRKGLGLDKRPELKDLYFGNYRRLVFLAQDDDPELRELAAEHARYLGLEYQYDFTGTAHVEKRLKEQVVRWQE